MRAGISRWGSVFALLLGNYISTASADWLSKEIGYIENLSGCFAVTYRFVEDGTHDMFSERYGLLEPIKEWIGLRQEEEGIFVLPHVSIVDSRIVPHWYEVWKHHPDQSTWTQEVWSQSPGDARSELRYECTAPWEGNRWECHAGKASKPFRDSGAPFGFNRTDYEWLDRKNILLVTEKGWVHNEHNKKMRSSDTTVSYELGWITYRRLEDNACQPAMEQFPRETKDTPIE